MLSTMKTATKERIFGEGPDMTERKEAKTRPSGKGLRMRELTEATGLPRSAILHYLAQGLLPEPMKTGRNMAYYDPACVERIGLIRQLQAKYAFPLSKIKSLLDSRDRGKDITPFIALNEMIFGAGDKPVMDKEAFCSASGLTREQLDDLTGNGLLVPLEKGTFDGQDLSLGRIYAQALAAGVKASELAFYSEAARKIVDCEMKLRQRMTGHLSDEEDAEITRKLVQGARMIRTYVIDRTFQKRVAGSQTPKDKELLS
jgi:DNA-binding transcriptional MerR regulator